ncbi:MAG: sterol desaturase family protein [Gemmatimonadetes bacterium]|nr:sterol desaturase family protein [Gemmatimonadota bacterium]
MSEYFVSNRDESVRMFRSDLLERTTYVHPWIPHLIYVPVVIALLWLSPLSLGGSALYFAIGLLIWTFIEYLLHRFAFHAPDEVMRETHQISAGLELDQAVIPELPTFRHVVYFIFHGVHHEYPSDSLRLVMPPVASLPMGLMAWVIFSMLFGGNMIPAFAGSLVGYLVYDTTHFVLHHRSVPTAFGKLIKRAHMRHHFLDPDEDYGVSSPLWDIIFRTYGGKKSAASA